jgi:hypothetical protein
VHGSAVSGFTELRFTDAKDFGPTEALQYWADILLSGINPQTVRLLALGGGPIAGIEYRLALALGAYVGVLDSSREARRLLLEPVWQTAPGLRVLRAAPSSVRRLLSA